MPNLGSTSVQVIFLHRLLALIVGVLVVSLLAMVWRERSEAPVGVLFATAALVLYGVQVVVGAANIWTEVADEVSTAHLAFGTLLWVVLAMLNIRAYRLYEWLPGSMRAEPHGDLAGVAR